MSPRPLLVYYTPGGGDAPPVVESFADARGMKLASLGDEDELLALVNRSFPVGLILNADAIDGATRICRVLKRDSSSAIVPVVMLAPAASEDIVLCGLEAGARSSAT